MLNRLHWPASGTSFCPLAKQLGAHFFHHERAHLGLARDAAYFATGLDDLLPSVLLGVVEDSKARRLAESSKNYPQRAQNCPTHASKRPKAQVTILRTAHTRVPKHAKCPKHRQAFRWPDRCRDNVRMDAVRPGTRRRSYLWP